MGTLGLERALSVEAPYIALVVSQPKRDKIFEYFREKGIASERLNRVILAQIVQVSRSKPKPKPARSLPIVTVDAKDPICGMPVNPAHAKHQSGYRDRTYYFCCVRCKQTFD